MRFFTLMVIGMPLMLFHVTNLLFLRKMLVKRIGTGINRQSDNVKGQYFGKKLHSIAKVIITLDSEKCG